MELRIEGISDLERRLKALPEQVQRVTLIKAVRAGAMTILNAARSSVPRKTGLLAKSLQMKFTRRGVSRVEASIGVFGLTGAKRRAQVARLARRGQAATARAIGDPYYALFVEKGHDIRHRGSKGVTGHVAARPFLRPALDENAQRAVEAVGQVLREEIDHAERL